MAPIGGVRLRLVGGPPGIVSWSLRGPASTDLDGLATERSSAPPPPSVEHPLGAVAVDHVVAITPDLDRTVARLDAAGLDRRRIRDAGGGHRQAFYVLGPALLEVGGPVGRHPEDPAAFWGLTLVVEDLDDAAARLDGRIGAVRDAVQPGRRIATVRREAGLSVPLALMTPRA